MKKIQIGKCMYNVVDADDYIQNKNIYNSKFTAIQFKNQDIIYPINSRETDITPGIYFYSDSDMVAKVVVPPKDKSEQYNSSNIIDYTNAKDIEDIIKKNKLVRDIQNNIIATSDNVLQLNIADSNSPEMKLLKTAINSKGIDKKQYEERFDQFYNDMRLLNGDNITLRKMISISTAFDIDIELTLKDKPGAPNPMGREYSVDLSEDVE